MIEHKFVLKNDCRIETVLDDTVLTLVLVNAGNRVGAIRIETGEVLGEEGEEVYPKSGRVILDIEKYFAVENGKIETE